MGIFDFNRDDPSGLESDEYLQWLKKFEVKKTTDDCYTPPAIYDAVVEYVDECLAALIQSSLRNGYELLVISDHGNVECMYDEKAEQPMTAHTTNEVPCVYIGWRNLRLRPGDLSDVAPTVLELLGIGKPSEMLGSSLIIG